VGTRVPHALAPPLNAAKLFASNLDGGGDSVGVGEELSMRET
jgi:hypothetical protein